MLSSGASRFALVGPGLSSPRTVPYRGFGVPLWETAGAAPTLDLNFAENRTLLDSVTGQNLVTFTRASAGTYVGSDGLIKTAAENVPRFDHNPVTGECLGLLVEEQRSNILLNSETLATQSVTVSATAYTLSFYGTGTVTLSGTSTAGPLVGTGVNSRVSLTFTPTAGSLTLTVSGTVQYANLEAGSFPTSWVPTTDSSATRSADVASITGAAFSGWYRQDEGTVFASGASRAAGSSSVPFILTLDGGSIANEINLGSRVSSRLATVSINVSGATVADMFDNAWNANIEGRIAAGYATDNAAISFIGRPAVTDSSLSVPTVAAMRIGNRINSFNPWNGTIRRLTFWPQRLPNTTLESITA